MASSARLTTAGTRKRGRRARVQLPAEGPRCSWCEGFCSNPAWGDGRCRQCHGEGRLGSERRTRCSACGGTGLCPVCLGSGVLADEFGEYGTEVAEELTQAQAG